MSPKPTSDFLNREISLLQFNRRVLAQALDESVPLLERLRFLCIASSNLDEFFEIRVAGIKQLMKTGSTALTPDGLAPAQLFAAIDKEAHALVEEQYQAFNDVVMPELERNGIRFLRRAAWTQPIDAWLRNFFHTEVLPVLSPIGLDPAHPFPRLLNKSLNFIVSLSGKDAFGREARLAVVQAPRALPRLIRIPKKVSGGADDFVFLSSIIHAYVDELFPGMAASGCYQFRVTRNSDLLVDEQEAEDLLEELEDSLEQRQWGDTVRLEIAHNCPGEMQRFLMDVLQLTEADIYRCNGPVNLMRLMPVPEMIERPDLKYLPFMQKLPAWSTTGDLFAAIREQDRLLHHPYDSFLPVIELLRQSAKDPAVLAIKQTLYRTGAKSPIVDALVDAARNGKEVTVIVELRARFDEADNIDLAERLQEVGAHVVYGVVGYKTHAKMMLIVRRETEGSGAGLLKNYVHLGTGNYHLRTSRIYTDYGLMSADVELCRDVHTVFLQLTSLGKVSKLNRMMQSPFSMVSGMHAKIAREIEAAVKGKPARIIAKMNGLVEPEMILKLYAASNAGVKIDLIVRGMCSLRPGVKGLSENIRVHSVIGRFLEHHRVFCFENHVGGEPEVYLSSADWMERNLFKRVEIAFPLLDKKIRTQVIEQLKAYIADTSQSWSLRDDGCYQRVSGGGTPVQTRLLEQLTGSEEPGEKKSKGMLLPRVAKPKKKK